MPMLDYSNPKLKLRHPNTVVEQNRNVSSKIIVIIQWLRQNYSKVHPLA
jgi:hypothetical protein